MRVLPVLHALHAAAVGHQAAIDVHVGLDDAAALHAAEQLAQERVHRRTQTK